MWKLTMVVNGMDGVGGEIGGVGARRLEFTEKERRSGEEE